MSGSLPRAVDPFRLAEEGASISGTLAVRQLGRLAAVCPEAGGAVQLTLTFGRDPVGRPGAVMHGQIEADLVLECQRCLGPMPWPLRVEVRLRFVPPGKLVPGAVDEADGDAVECVPPLVLADAVEDEILLALPMAPVHEVGACSGRAGSVTKQGS